MKKYLIAITCIVALACNETDKDAAIEPAAEVAPLTQSKNSERFNSGFGNLLNAYYELKDALVASDAAQATNYANQLGEAADTLSLAALTADPSIVETAKLSAGSIAAEAKALAAENGIEEKRKSFQVISDNMYDLVRTVRYDRETIYHQYCPMAFNDAGAYWLSNNSDIKNPYFGKKMLTCGEVKDSINFNGQ